MLGICQTVDSEVAQGRTALPAILKCARRYAGMVYRCDPSRELPFSFESLRRVYYRRWLRYGRKPAALGHRYGVSAPRLTLRPGQMQLLPGLMETCDSLSAVYRGLYAPMKRPPSLFSFRRTFSKAELLFLCRMFAERRQLRARKRAVQQRLRTWASSPTRTFSKGQS